MLVSSLNEPKNEERNGCFYDSNRKSSEEDSHLTQHDNSSFLIFGEELKMTAKAGFHRFEFDDIACQIERLETLACLMRSRIVILTRPKIIK